MTAGVGTLGGAVLGISAASKAPLGPMGAGAAKAWSPIG